MKQARTRMHDCGDDLRQRVAAWGRAGFARLLRAEFTKFRTVRAWVIAICAAAVVFVLLSFLSAFASRAPVRAIPAGPDGEAVSDTYMFVHRTLVGDGALTARVAFSQSSKGGPNSQLDPGLALSGRPPPGGCGSPGPEASSPATTPPTEPAGPRSAPPA
jgi:hypothetical protein